jgi:hypothetical protein
VQSILNKFRIPLLLGMKDEHFAFIFNLKKIILNPQISEDSKPG